MKKLFLYLICASFALPVFGQNSEDLTKKGFVFPKFTEGKVIFAKESNSYDLFLNYDAVLNKMCFVNQQTGSYGYFVDHTNITSITVGDRVFSPGLNGDFFEEIKLNDGNKLFVSHNKRLLTKDTGETGLFAGNQTNAIQKASHIRGAALGSSSSGLAGVSQGVYNMDTSSSQDIKDDNNFYIFTDGSYKSVTKLNQLIDIFGHKNEIRAYVKDNKLSFDSIEDVAKIVEYANSL